MGLEPQYTEKELAKMNITVGNYRGLSLDAAKSMIAEKGLTCEIIGNGTSVVTHRVIEKHDDHYVTQGTANNTEDDPIVPESIIGRVVFVIPYFGVVIEWLRTPIGMLTLLCVGALLFELPNIIEYVKKLISRTEGE
jgi:hypothetical protein